MDGIASFLERFKNFTPPSRAITRAIEAALIEILDISLSENQIKVKNGVVHIAIGGVQKSEILLHKQEILSAARVRAGNSLKDIV